MPVPVQHEAAREMAANFDGGYAGEDFLRCAADVFAERGARVVGSRDPFGVFGCEVDGAVELCRPFDVGSVVVRMRYLLS